MKETYKYIGWYLFVYVVLILIYGLVQLFTICTDMQGYECNFSETKILAFLTVVAYILTPIVAILGFQSWRKQYKYQNQKDRFNKLFESCLRLNSEIKILRVRDISVRKINPNETLLDYEQNYLDKNYEDYLDRIAGLERIYEECLNHISILEFTLDTKMNGLKKIIHSHQNIYEKCRYNYKLYLDIVNTNQYNCLRDTYHTVFSYRKEMIDLQKIEDKIERENKYEISITQKLIRMTDRINKYIRNIEKFY